MGSFPLLAQEFRKPLLNFEYLRFLSLCLVNLRQLWLLAWVNLALSIWLNALFSSSFLLCFSVSFIVALLLYSSGSTLSVLGFLFLVHLSFFYCFSFGLLHDSLTVTSNSFVFSGFTSPSAFFTLFNHYFVSICQITFWCMQRKPENRLDNCVHFVFNFISCFNCINRHSLINL